MLLNHDQYHNFQKFLKCSNLIRVFQSNLQVDQITVESSKLLAVTGSNGDRAITDSVTILKL